MIYGTRVTCSGAHLRLISLQAASRTAMSLSNSSPLEVAKAASISSRSLATLSTEARNNALTAIHEALAKSKGTILAANAKDLELANKAAENGELSQSVLKRLDLARKGKWEDMLQGILDVRDLEDPGKDITRCKTFCSG